ncbi:DUF4232 domain-containing protein [Streptomyces sp. NPDC001817]|uniref:DUF4232 domain-containing protein n=1 Tax=Streptomyces sp. NPDC001817 TaxID=3154398 RepID=UPI0033253899
MTARQGVVAAAGVVAAVLVGTALAGTAAADTAHVHGAAVPACRTADLTASLHGSQAGAGNFGKTLVLANASHRTCTVTGYPGLGLENARHKTQRIKVVWGATYFQHDPGRHTVTLKPGQAATAVLAWNAPQGRTSLTPAYLQVTPPNQRTDLTIPFAPGAIDAGTLHVTALAAQKPVKPTNPLKVSVYKFTNHGPVAGALRPGDTADVVVSGCGAGAQGLTTSKAFVGGSAQLVPSADRPTVQGFPKIARVAAGTYRVSAQCPDVATTAVTTITVQ